SVDPLVLNHPLEEGVDHASEGGSRRTEIWLELGGDLEHHVVHGDDRTDAGGVVRWGDDDPGTGHGNLTSIDTHDGVDRAIAGVVVPEVVVGEGDGDGPWDSRSRVSQAAKDEQSSISIGA